MRSLLPDTAAQADWVRRQVERLEVEQRELPAPAAAPSLAQRFLEPTFLGSLGLFVLVASGSFGPAFGVGLAAQILVHEMGHYIDIRRRGLPADMPVFLPGLGAFVRWRALGVSARTRAEVSLAGPLAGWIAAIGCAGIWWVTADEIWATLAHAGAMLNLLNLMPVWALDGGQAAAALDRSGRWILLMICLVLWPLLGQPVFVLVAGGIVFRLAQRDAPAEPCLPITVYFAVVLILLGLVLGGVRS